MSVNQTLFKGVTADPIAGYPSTFLIINDKCKRMDCAVGNEVVRNDRVQLSGAVPSLERERIS